MAGSSTSSTVIYAPLGGLVGALVMGALALMMPVPGTGGAPFFVAAAMLMGMSSMSLAAGWILHLATGVVIGSVFGAVVANVSRLALRSTGRAFGLGAVAGVVAFFAWFLPMMAMLMPALMGMPMMVAGGFAAHVIYGLVLGGVASLSITKSRSSFRCPTCGASLASQQELMEHEAKAHPM